MTERLLQHTKFKTMVPFHVSCNTIIYLINSPESSVADNFFMCHNSQQICFTSFNKKTKISDV